MEAKHTPTPWSEATRGPNNCPIIGARGLMVAMLTTGVDFQETADANAEFIVRAVNCHAQLIASLKSAKKRLKMVDKHLDCEYEMTLIDAALSAAGEQS